MVNFLLLPMHNDAKIDSSKKIAQMVGGCQAECWIDHKIRGADLEDFVLLCKFKIQGQFICCVSSARAV